MVPETKDEKYVYFFGEGSKDMAGLLGGKGANLAEMTKMKIPVPPGFTVTTRACLEFYKNNQRIPEKIREQIESAFSRLEELMKAKFGSPEKPLLVSVRSGAPVSMPGMMDTILNLGLNDEVVRGLVRLTKDERMAYDSYRRLIQMFGNVVMGVKKEAFEEIIEEVKRPLGIKLDIELDADSFKRIIIKFKHLIRQKVGQEFPQEPAVQLERACEAVFKSWHNPRAKTYRELHGIPDDLGTAVNIQVMVFGNMGDDSGTGVLFSRDPATGKNELFGEFLVNAQGEDVVAGVRTPMGFKALEERFPAAFQKLTRISKKLEKHYKDMQDIEFTIQKRKLYVLQTRNGKRTAQAAVKIVVDMVKEGLLNKEEALLKINPEQIDQLLHPIIDPKDRDKVKVIAKGLAASPGAASGQIVFTADEAEKLGEKEPVILVRTETCPDDIHGMAKAQGILTSRGGMTSHAAVVARGMGKTCVAGCEALQINEKENIIKVGDLTLRKGDWVTICGSTGEVMAGKVPTVQPTPSREFSKLMSWADKARRLRVRANADYPRDARIAREWGAEGIGLCRTEHMFFEEDRLPLMRKMILAENAVERKKALEKLLPLQKNDFVGLFKEMRGLPVTIRLLDPPLHEFLPRVEELLVEVTKLKATKKKIKSLAQKEALLRKVRNLHEMNPMLGHRGCRLAITYPEIVEMQTRAIFEAAVEVAKEGIKVLPEVMIPVVGIAQEVKLIKEQIVKIATEIIKSAGVKVKYTVGTMMELPRACLIADKIAKEASFFSFGTNDLTQTTFGFSRDDAEGKFIVEYINKGILAENPFQVLDKDGVGALIKMSVEKGRLVNPNLKIGICGEHGGEPKSIAFCHSAELDYVSCSPYRVPIARLAAAQAAVEAKRKK